MKNFLDEIRNELTNCLEVRRNRKLNRLRRIAFGEYGLARDYIEVLSAIEIISENKA